MIWYENLSVNLSMHDARDKKKEVCGSFHKGGTDPQRNSVGFGLDLSPDAAIISPDKTEGIFCPKIPVHGMCTDPAPPPAEIPIVTTRTPAIKPGLFIPELCEHRMGGICPDSAERLIFYIPYQKIFRTGELARVHIPMRIDICHAGTSTAPPFEGQKELASFSNVRRSVLFHRSEKVDTILRGINREELYGCRIGLFSLPVEEREGLCYLSGSQL